MIKWLFHTARGQRPPAPARRNPLLRATLIIVILATAGGLWYRSSHLFVVEEVLDGDTLRIDWHGTARLVQLAGADAPELHKGTAGQPYAREARQYLIERILHKRVWIEFEDAGRPTDYKGRLLCWVWHGQENVSYSLVARGLAQFSGTAEGARRSVLVALEQQARRLRRGLWSLPPGAMPTREHRDGPEYLYKEHSEERFKPEPVER